MKDKPEKEAQRRESVQGVKPFNGEASSESILTILKDIIEHGSWKYLLEVHEKLETEKGIVVNIEL